MRRTGLRVVTWNVWFNSWERELRQRALWAEIAENDPDIICLQEVIPAHLAGPELDDLRDRGYWVSDEPIDRYDVVMATRRPVLESERVPLPSIMGRNLLVVRLDTRPALTVATVHLESTAEMTARRCRQLTEIDARLASEADVLLLGDMNFPDGARPEAAILAGWTDVWTACHPGDPGFTVDSEVNAMRAQIKPGTKRGAHRSRVSSRRGVAGHRHRTAGDPTVRVRPAACAGVRVRSFRTAGRSGAQLSPLRPRQAISDVNAISNITP